MRSHTLLLCVLVLVLMLSHKVLAQKEVSMNAGKTKIKVSVHHEEGEDCGDECGKEAEEDAGEPVEIKLPPEPKAAKGYVPRHPLPQEAPAGGDAQANVGSPINQPIIIAPVIGATQPSNSPATCTDNCDAELAPPEVQIAGPVVASHILNKEIFEDDNYVSVADSQVEARPARGYDAGSECGQDCLDAKEAKLKSSEESFKHAMAHSHHHNEAEVERLREEIAKDRRDLAKLHAKEQARGSGSGSGSGSSGAGQGEDYDSEKARLLAMKTKLEKELGLNNSTNQERFREVAPPEHRIPATPVEREDVTPLPLIGDLGDLPDDAPCGCTGKPACGCEKSTPPVSPCTCEAAPCPSECHIITQAERDAKKQEELEKKIKANQEKARLKLEGELKQHQSNMDQISRMARSLRYQYGTLRQQHDRLRSQLLASKIAIKNLGPDPFKGTEYDIEGPAGGKDDDDDLTQPMDNIDHMVKKIKMGVYGLSDETAAEILAKKEVDGAILRSQLAANAINGEAAKKEIAIGVDLTKKAVQNAQNVTGKGDSKDAQTIAEQLKAVLQKDAGAGSAGAAQRILAVLGKLKGNNASLKDLDREMIAQDKQMKADMDRMDWEEALVKMEKMVDTLKFQHTYQTNSYSSMQLKNRLRVCLFLERWGAMDDTCKWLMYEAFRYNAPPKNETKKAEPAKPAQPAQPAPAKNETKPEPPKDNSALLDSLKRLMDQKALPTAKPAKDEDVNFLPHMYGGTMGWAHAQPKKFLPN